MKPPALFASRTWKRWLRILLIVATVVITIVTGRSLYGPTAAGGGDYSLVFLILLYVNLFLVLFLGFLVIRNAARLWLERRRRQTGSQLRTRMALMFVALSLLPSLVITLFSVEMLNRGVDSWFSDRIQQALKHSMDVAGAYYRENQRTVRHDAESIVRNRHVTAGLMLQGEEAASSALEVERLVRGLDEVAIIHADGTRVAYAGDLPFDPMPDLTTLAEGATRALLFVNEAGDRVRAFVRLDSDLYLSTGRWIDRQILGQMEVVENAYVDYNQLRSAHGVLKSTHTSTLVLITLILLLVAVWSGFRIADSVTDPIAELVVGTLKVANGDLSVNLSVSGDDELATLMAAFNAMTQKLTENRAELESTNALLEERRRFMEAVVRNISAGVINVNRHGEISLMNPRAGDLLGMDTAASLGRPHEEVIPEAVLSTLDTLRKGAETHAGQDGADGVNPAAQIELPSLDKPRTLMMRLTLLEDRGRTRQGFILTFDDLTEILVAQRASTWSDVARRIAHEIKNPLTPIQLSAERVRRRYLALDPTKGDPIDWTIMDDCTKTIVQQVEELRVLVNEFSTFARLPKPNLKNDQFNQAVQEVMILHQAELKGLKVTVTLEGQIPPFPFDRGQIKQVLTNLLANASAAIRENDGEEKGRLAIATALSENGLRAILSVADNGPGIKPADRDRALEPYFTTKKKGTGLGLAIVKKIVEDHGGTLRIRESEWGGALVEIQLPLSGPAHQQPPVV